MDEFFRQVWDIITTLVDPRNLTNPEAFKRALNQPGVMYAALAAVCTIIFTETGLLVGLLLPGDSLLVVLGLVANLSGWNVWLFIACLIVAAVIGDTTGYWIGRKAGPAIFSRPDARIFKQKYILEARRFYEKHGRKAVVVARFMPILRTFAPVVAGASKMNYRTFLSCSIAGSIGWIGLMVLFGYYALQALDALVQNALDKPDFTCAKHIDKVIAVIVLLSVSPMLVKAFLEWRKAKRVAGV
jgi:membrane-associated protein